MTKMNGFTLTEVLIALVVLSIGLLGLASLQAESLKKSNDAYLSSIASAEASDIIDRMRANYTEAKGGGYITTSPTSGGTSNIGCLGGIPNAPASGGGTATSCAGHQMSLNDIYEWQTNIASVLPQGKGDICLSNSPGAVGGTLSCNNQGDVYVIAISWRNRDGNTQEFRVSFKP